MKKYAIIIALIFSFFSPAIDAFSWSALWKNKQQREVVQLKEGVTAYRQTDYQTAISVFSQYGTSDSDYNRGNALAKSGKLDAAINAYNDALKSNPDNQDAIFNRKLVEQLKQQQQKKRQASNQKKNQQDQNKKQNYQLKKAKQQEKIDKNEQQTGSQQASIQPSEQHSKKSISQSKQVKQQQANQQWLDQIADDPGGLLKQKFLRDHYHQQLQAGERS